MQGVYTQVRSKSIYMRDNNPSIVIHYLEGLKEASIYLLLLEHYHYGEFRKSLPM